MGCGLLCCHGQKLLRSPVFQSWVSSPRLAVAIDGLRLMHPDPLEPLAYGYGVVLHRPIRVCEQPHTPPNLEHTLCPASRGEDVNHGLVALPGFLCIGQGGRECKG